MINYVHVIHDFHVSSTIQLAWMWFHNVPLHGQWYTINTSSLRILQWLQLVSNDDIMVRWTTLLIKWSRFGPYTCRWGQFVVILDKSLAQPIVRKYYLLLINLLEWDSIPFTLVGIIEYRKHLQLYTVPSRFSNWVEA